tara:strand:- start:69 stop:398 length:330 start_codon:yes stop_codon:yes gene_type:complete
MTSRLNQAKFSIKGQNSMSTQGSDFHINPDTETTWNEASKTLPEKILINGQEHKTSELSEKTKKLALIYLNDRQIIGQFKELIALAELGLNAVNKEVQDSLMQDTSNKS